MILMRQIDGEASLFACSHRHMRPATTVDDEVISTLILWESGGSNVMQKEVFQGL